MMIQRIVTALILFVSVATFATAADYILVTNPNTILAEVDQQTLRNMFLGKKTSWSDGTPVFLVTLKKGEEHAAFTRGFLRKSPKQYATFWKRQLFTGKGRMPLMCNDSAEAKTIVATTPGGLGYISPEALDDSVTVIEQK